MIIVRAPLRITLGGGGTDLPSWYSQRGGFLISAAIDKYVYITGSERPFDSKIWLSYSKVEVCNSISEIQHRMFAKILEKYEIKKGVEIHSISDLPGESGLGSSGAFIVATCNMLNHLYRKDVRLKDLAEETCHIEMIELGNSSGKQDQYISAYGGIQTMTFTRDGEVTIAPLNLSPITVKTLSSSILIYYSGVSRKAETILKEQSDSLKNKSELSQECMSRIAEIGYESRAALVSGRVDDFGALLHEHWQVKKRFSSKMSSSSIDGMYDEAMSAGALGGKIMGAGGGGYYMFYVPGAKQLTFREKMQSLGLIEMTWSFDHAGTVKIFSN